MDCMCTDIHAVNSTIHLCGQVQVADKFGLKHLSAQKVIYKKKTKHVRGVGTDHTGL